MRFLIPLTVAVSALAQPSVTLHPSVITDCASYGLGATTVEWHAPGASGLVQVLVGSVQASFTGHVPPDGRSTTGVWVNDGMPFLLVDSAGNTLASTTAHVVCSPQGGPVAAGLAAAGYLPLDIGNRWVYRTKTRFSTTGYVQWLVTGSQEIDGQLWFTVAVGASAMLLRQDSSGRIYTYSNGQSSLWLDPNTPQDSSAQLQIKSRGPLQNSLGAFADAVNYVRDQGLILETGTFVRGIGLLSSSSTMLTGSSGGFVDSLDLVEARIDGHIAFRPQGTSVELTMEAPAFDLTHGVVTNCILPCYFAACGLGSPQPDPPGTYKPCFRAGAKVSGATAPAGVSLAILDGSGNVLLQSEVSTLLDDSGRSEGFVQMPLYTSPNQPLPPGTYQLRATAGGTSAALAFEIE